MEAGCCRFHFDAHESPHPPAPSRDHLALLPPSPAHAYASAGWPGMTKEWKGEAVYMP
jgi:hypothetical protein